MRQLKWLLSNQLKISRTKHKISGFTLIELLVAMIIAALIITPLLGFMVNILDNDRKEQAKTNSDQEIKTALDYIARDLQQSVYIYDADGIDKIRSKLPNYNKKDKFLPVLVFWKRQYISGGLTVGSGTDDTFVYSLVAYYLINDGDKTWSNAARIGRFQISNGYGATDTQISNTKDKGFELFDLKDEGNLKIKMNNWKKDSVALNYDQNILPLVDYIDQTTTDTTINPAPTCSTNPNVTMVPQFTGSGDKVATDNVKTRGFYVCVDSANTVVEVYLRGNALARIQSTDIDYKNGRKIYFPEANIRVQGLGYLFTK